MDSILKDIQAEFQLFFNGLNWTYIFIYLMIIYGIKYKEEFQWYDKLFDNREKLKPFKMWSAGILTGIVFCVFHYLEKYDFQAIYVAQMLRSWIVVIVFNSIFTSKKLTIDK